MIDWTLAGRIGGFVAGTPVGGTRVAGDLPALTEDALARVTAYTQLTPEREVPAPEAVDRRAWLDANLRSMRSVMAPLDEKLEEKAKSGSGPAAGPLRGLSGLLLGAEIGALSGYLAQRVLGQYELVLLDAASPERLLFVAPNLRELAVKLEVDEAELLAWVAFHEVTHAVQFTSVPWLREHLADLLRRLLETVDVRVDPLELLRVPSLDDVRALVDRVQQGGLVHLVAGPERMALLDEMQATMALVEGHAEHVMDVVGAEALEGLEELRSALERRRDDKPPAARLLEKLLGLELKLRQYRVGKAFCDEVVEAGGIEALNRAWAHPAALPTLAELEDPQAWLRRTSSAAA